MLLLTFSAIEVPARKQNGNSYNIPANESWDLGDTISPIHDHCVILQDILEPLLVAVLKRSRW